MLVVCSLAVSPRLAKKERCRCSGRVLARLAKKERCRCSVAGACPPSKKGTMQVHRLVAGGRGRRKGVTSRRLEILPSGKTPLATLALLNWSTLAGSSGRILTPPSKKGTMQVHRSFFGAGGGGRTRTPLLAKDFESSLSAIPTHRQAINSIS